MIIFDKEFGETGVPPQS